MSGDQLRTSTILNNLSMVTSLLNGGANPCSRDDSSLTSLHYAIFNGHFAATKVLISNCQGKDEDGVSCNSNDLVTDSGYTCLHLAVMFDPLPYRDEELGEKAAIIRYLIQCGQMLDATDDLGRTAKELAKDNENGVAVEIIEEYEKDPMKVDEILAFLEAEGEIYDLHFTKRVLNLEYCQLDKNGNPVVLREDKLPIPLGQTIPENHILPTALKNYKALRKDGKQAIKNLVNVKEEARVNEQRRNFLANSSEHMLRLEGKMN